MTGEANSEEKESNPFILPGLPDHTVAAGRRLAAESKRRRRQPKPEGDYDDWDDSPSEPLLPTGSLAESLAAHHETLEPEGDWSDWLEPTPHRAPLSPGDEDYPEGDYDDWDDDWGEDGTRHPRRRPTAPTIAWWRARKIVSRAWPTLAATAVTVGIVATATIVVMLNVQDTDNTAGAAQQTEPRAGDAAPITKTTKAAPEARGHAVAGCRSTSTDSITIGAGPGDTTSPQDVILKLEWAYYIDRDVSAITALTAPEAAVPPEHIMQAGIDAQPEGTRYCVYITAADTGGTTWDVELHEQWPSEDQPSKYAQTITTTTDRSGKTLITGIRAAR